MSCCWEAFGSCLAAGCSQRGSVVWCRHPLAGLLSLCLNYREAWGLCWARHPDPWILGQAMQALLCHALVAHSDVMGPFSTCAVRSLQQSHLLPSGRDGSCTAPWCYFCFSNCTKIRFMSFCQQYWEKSTSPGQQNRLQTVADTLNFSMFSLGLFGIPALNACTWPFSVWMALYLQSLIYRHWNTSLYLNKLICNKKKQSCTQPGRNSHVLYSEGFKLDELS